VVRLRDRPTRFDGGALEVNNVADAGALIR